MKEKAVGRPKKNITEKILFDLYDEYRNWYTVAEHLGVANSTVYRRLSEYGISRKYSAK